jgi:hypothetical protein
MPKFGERVFDKTDLQQFRVYRAERQTAFSREPIFASLGDIVTEAKRVMQSPTWAALSRHTLQEGREIEFRKGRGRNGKARVFVNQIPRIIMPPHQWQRWTLFHELAHCARGHLSITHGPQFTASYLRLIHDCWSPELALQLWVNFDRNRVRVHDWWEPGREIPVPDPASIAVRLDEGAEEEMAEERRSIQQSMTDFRWRLVRGVGRYLEAYLEQRVRHATRNPELELMTHN